jgi:pectin methylesterase-like acyl-CoA thioesterase/lysophospholipase L1-like esterase
MKAQFAYLLVLIAALGAASRADLALVERWPIGDGACADTPLRLTFDQPPLRGAAGKIEIRRSADGQPVACVDLGDAQPAGRFGSSSEFLLRYEPVRISGKTASIQLPAGKLGNGESYVVRISPGAFKDAAGHDFAGVSEGWQFRIRSALPANPSRLIVAADGSGDFCTVQGAVDQIQPHRRQPALIFIRKGRYEELARIGRERTQIRLLGEDRDGTVISYANNEKLNPGWIQRAVLGVEGDDFVLENLTVQNTTPYKGSQAEAVFVNAERCMLRNARFLSFQDTLNLSGRVYVANSTIEGDVDYVWGYGSACFERCELRSMHDGYCVQARNSPEKNGYVFIGCKFTAAPGVKKTWLARIETNRFPASHVAFIGCQMGPHVPAAGWQFTGPASAALRFEEYQSVDPTGAPLDLSQRDPSAKQLTAPQAVAESDPAKVLAGSDGWNPKTISESGLRLAIIGDSTVCEYPSQNPARGWGHYIQDYFKDDVQVINLAASGRSTRTFIAEGRWQKTLELKPRFILIQFGHNDSHDPSHPEATDAATTYKDFLRRYIDEARAVGATPILVTPMCRRTFEGGKLQDGLLRYADAMKEIAVEKKAALIDLHAASRAYFEQLGETASLDTANKAGDQTHFNEKGAKAMAGLVMKELPAAAPELKEFLR